MIERWGSAAAARQEHMCHWFHIFSHRNESLKLIWRSLERFESFFLCFLSFSSKSVKYFQLLNVRTSVEHHHEPDESDPQIHWRWNSLSSSLMLTSTFNLRTGSTVSNATILQIWLFLIKHFMDETNKTGRKWWNSLTLRQSSFTQTKYQLSGSEI